MEELKNQLSQAIDYRRRCLIDCIVGGERGILDKLWPPFKLIKIKLCVIIHIII